MSDYHILTGRPDGNGYRVVFHVPVPDVPNRVGNSYRTCIVNSGMGGSSALTEGTGPGQISSAELAQIQSGEVYEVSEEFHTNPDEDAAQIRDRIDARHAEVVTQVQSEVVGKLSYFGFSRDIV